MNLAACADIAFWLSKQYFYVLPESESELESGELLPLATVAPVASATVAAAALPLPHFIIAATRSTESLRGVQLSDSRKYRISRLI